jgi:hypothetical protein
VAQWRGLKPFFHLFRASNPLHPAPKTTQEEIKWAEFMGKQGVLWPGMMDVMICETRRGRLCAF